MMTIILSQYQVTDKFSHLWGVYAMWAFPGAEGILTEDFFKLLCDLKLLATIEVYWKSSFNFAE